MGYLCVSPFAVLWNGYHCLLAPIGGHTGFEVNFNQSQFHYLHHRFFECNYGGFAISFDKWFGTFRDKLPHGSASESHSKAMDTKASLGWPTGEYFVYASFLTFCWAALPSAVMGYLVLPAQLIGIIVVMVPI